MLPEGWTAQPMSKLLERVIDYRGKAPPKTEDGVRLLTARNVRMGHVSFNHAEYIDAALYEGWMNRGLPQSGDIMFTTEAPLANVAMFPNQGTFALGQRIVTLRPNETCVSGFLFQFLLSDHGQGLVHSKASGSTALGIKSRELVKLPIPLPPLSEQRKIADILSTWDQAIEKTEALLANARTQKRALMQQLLTGKRRFPEFDGQPWKEVRLGDICKPKQWTTIAAKNMTDEGFPVYGANGHIGWFDEYNHEQETIAVGCRGVCGSVHLTPPKSYITGNSMALDAVDPTKAIVRYLFQYLAYFGFRDIVSGSAQPQITGKAIKAYRLRLPPVGEQQIIANLLQAADDNVLLVEAAITKLRTEKRALMQQLLTGKRRVVA